MIRKCQRLAHSYSANKPRAKVPFLSIHAPLDFRLKEMEKWIRLHGEPDEYSKKKLAVESVRPRNSFCCDRCANLVPHHHTASRRSSIQSIHSRRSGLSERSSSKAVPASPRRARSSKSSSLQSDHKPSPVASSIVLNESLSHHESHERRLYESSIHEERRENHVHASFAAQESRSEDSSNAQESSFQGSRSFRTRQIKHSRSMSYDERKFAESGLHEIKRTMHVIPEASEVSTGHSTRSAVEHEVSLSKLSIISPEPLPHPYHGSTSAAFLGIVESPVDPPEVLNIGPDWGHDVEDEGLRTPPSEDEPTGDYPPQPNMLRRRSSLKRSNSDLRMSMAYSAKTVSWAMDRDWADQISKYHTAAGAMEHAGR
jgi:hypothetical protein